MTEQNKVTTEEILEAINSFANHTEQRFQKLEGDVAGLKGDVGMIKSNMVTKDYLNDKLADLRGDLVVLLRKEDYKLEALLKILSEKKAISVDEAKNVLAMEPFPRMAIN